MGTAGIQQGERKQHRKGQGGQRVGEHPKTVLGTVTDKSSQERKEGRGVGRAGPGMAGVGSPGAEGYGRTA